MFLEPTMSTSLEVILSELCQKMSIIPVVMSRVPYKSRKQVLPSIAFLLDQLQIVVADINNGSNTVNNIHHNFIWDSSHDFPIYGDSDVSIDFEEILHDGRCLKE